MQITKETLIPFSIRKIGIFKFKLYNHECFALSDILSKVEVDFKI